MEQRCYSCGAPLMGKKCDYCGAKKTNDKLLTDKLLPIKETHQRSNKEELIELARIQERREIRAEQEEKRAKFWDGVITCVGVFFLLIASTGIMAILNTSSEFDHTFESEFPLVSVFLVLGAIPLIWVAIRKRGRRKR